MGGDAFSRRVLISTTLSYVVGVDIIIDIMTNMILVSDVLHSFTFVARSLWGKVDLLTSRKQLSGYDQFRLSR